LVSVKHASGERKLFNKGDRVRVTVAYPINNENPNLMDIEKRGKTGTVVNAEFLNALSWVSVLLDVDSSNPDAWGCFYAQELELVNAD
jgi:ribosomal protein L21E